MKRTILISLAILFLCSPLMGQEYGLAKPKYKQIYSGGYQITLPVGPSASFASSLSYQGWDFNFTHFITDKIAVAADFSWYITKKKMSKIAYYPDENTAFYASQYRIAQSFPIKAQCKYFFTPDKLVKTYVALGVGAINYTCERYIPDYKSTSVTWGFLASPEVGLYLPFGALNPIGVSAALGYNYGTNGNNMGFYFNVGVFYTIFKK